MGFLDKINNMYIDVFKYISYPGSQLGSTLKSAYSMSICLTASGLRA